jgi:hypothetical protein
MRDEVATVITDDVLREEARIVGNTQADLLFIVRATDMGFGTETSGIFLPTVAPKPNHKAGEIHMGSGSSLVAFAISTVLRFTAAVQQTK